MPLIDPATLTAELIRCESVTPTEGGAISHLEKILSEANFVCERIERGGIHNLYARYGSKGPVFGFNGHTDVVPVGDASAWTHPPFSAHIADDMMWGRGATDMKSGVAAFVSAAVKATKLGIPGSIVIMITGDEEGPGKDGTLAILDWMKENHQAIDHCLVGEPTSREEFGDMIKIGRRGSVTAYITAHGKQGHVAYPDRAINPVTALIHLLQRLTTRCLDDGSTHFDPSTLAVTTIDVGNKATNVIPATARATVNIRFNDLHTSDTLSLWIRQEIDRMEKRSEVKFSVEFSVSGESFLTPTGPFTDLVTSALRRVTGFDPVLSTSGGTSDARFIRYHCPVLEVGLTGLTMHQVDERVLLWEIHQLTQVYGEILRQYFE